MTTLPQGPVSNDGKPSPTSRFSRRGPLTRARIREIGAALLAAAALGVLFGLAPKDAVSATDISFVMAGDKVNQDSADSAPKQTVVNGWTTRDLLELVAKQEVANHDPRPAALLTLGVLALCLNLATSEGAAGARGRETTTATAVSAPEPADLP